MNFILMRGFEYTKKLIFSHNKIQEMTNQKFGPHGFSQYRTCAANISPKNMEMITGKISQSLNFTTQNDIYEIS